MADTCEIKREGDIGDVFRYLAGKEKDKMPSYDQVNKVLNCLVQNWLIVEEKLVPKHSSILIKKSSSGSSIVTHKNFSAAKIGAAVAQQVPDSEICLINTYLATVQMDQETYQDNLETIKNWLAVQNRKVKIIILRPEGKGMFLRTKTSLDSNGTDLANTLILHLSILIKLMDSYPGQLEVKMMDEIPGMAAFILPDRLFYGLHYSFGHTETGSWFEITDPGMDCYLHIKRHFDTLWNDPMRTTPLTPDLLDHYKRALNIVKRDPEFLHNSNWKVYLHDLSSVALGKREAPFTELTGKITHWKLRIEKPEKGVYLKAHLEIPDSNIKLPEVNLITENLSDRDYAHARFSDFGTLSIHLSFHCRKAAVDDPFMLGYFILSAGGDCCAGYIVLEKIDQPDIVRPPTDERDIASEPYLHRLLSFRDSSYYSLERTRTEKRLFRPLPYQGKYKVYSYGGSRGGAKCIKQNWLYIDQYGIATYRNQEFPRLTGRATLLDQHLHGFFIHYDNDNTDLQRRSYLIISVRGRKAKKGRYYSAIQLGVSTERDMPTGKRYILEYVDDQPIHDKDKPVKIALHSKSYQDLPPGLAGLLSGRVKNLLGFLRTGANIDDIHGVNKEWETHSK
ncbi:MAG: hypothetical protein IPK76_26085 [Lewinellaceae bacterium]|nr:hypothetical protein [Lewinellaceae bacterium]